MTSKFTEQVNEIAAKGLRLAKTEPAFRSITQEQFYQVMWPECLGYTSDQKKMREICNMAFVCITTEPPQ